MAFSLCKIQVPIDGTHCCQSVNIETNVSMLHDLIRYMIIIISNLRYVLCNKINIFDNFLYIMGKKLAELSVYTRDNFTITVA